MSRRYSDPLTGEPLTTGVDGHLYDVQGQLKFENHEGSYDFVVDEHSRNEREFYNATYADGGWWSGTDSLDTADYQGLWNMEPGSPEYLRSVGDVSGRKILLIGNGTSIKELLFIKRGAHVTFTDLSFKAVAYARNRYRASALGKERREDCEFHAVNAYYLPFEESTFDIVCADAVVHHLSDLKQLFAGIHRCLKPGGHCRFLDSAYSPWWQAAKAGVLRPLQKRVHEKCGISPEDQVATERGGYTREELEHLKDDIGFGKVYYERVALFDFLLWRAHCKLRAPWMLAVRPAIRSLDWIVSKTPLMTNQGISLVFGFSK